MYWQSFVESDFWFLSFPKFPSLFSFGLFSKAGPTMKQVREFFFLPKIYLKHLCLLLYSMLCWWNLFDSHNLVHSVSCSLVESLFHHSPPLLSQIENTCFSLTFFGEGYSDGTDPSQGRPNAKICTQVIGAGKTTTAQLICSPIKGFPTCSL